ncbi:alpha/beta hydrolase [uncultured Clostridium sp.]|uniref:alpha/beta hydrolase n=1 Tax=uncultured Clostridium sp. TaxID=59620 RepID=UPI0025D9DFF3|nr:alpha/beta hydrolase [uncultured Clostridium sp.]
MKKVKWGITAIIILVIIVIVLLGVGNYFYNLALNPNSSKELVLKQDTKATSASREENWILDQSNYCDEEIESFDNLKLHGYKINNENSNVWVITVHGYMGSGAKMASYAENFYNIGYNVLVPDLRGHGKSEGDYIGMGWNDRKDILRWIDLILKENNNAKIILHGVSMGGATVMMTSGEKLPENVKCIIEDCGYSSVVDEFEDKLKNIFNLPKTPILQAADLVSRVRAGYWFSDASSVNQLKKAKVPILFIHGDKDDFVPYDMLDKVYNAADVEKEKLVVEGAEHAKSAYVNPELYWNTISNFINKHLE